jgi:hypothetical protein
MGGEGFVAQLVWTIPQAAGKQKSALQGQPAGRIVTE